MNQPYKLKDHYDLIDLGCGEERLRLKALQITHPSWSLLGIDPKIETTYTPKLDLIGDSATRVLPVMREGSVRIANADYFFNNLTEEAERRAILDELRRVLRPEGRLVVRCRKESIHYIDGLLDAAGYDRTAPSRVSPEDAMLMPQVILENGEEKVLERLVGDLVAGIFTGELPDPEAAHPMLFSAVPR